MLLRKTNAAFVLSIIVVGAVNGAELETPSERPNVLFLAVDDMKDWVNCLGGYKGTVVTPNIDALAARGTLFTNAHCPSPKCAPSRAAIMTGLRASTTGLYDNGHWWRPNLPDAVSLPAYFRSHGYHTAGAGKIFHHTAGNHPPAEWHEFQRLVFKNDPWFRSVKLNYPWSKSAPNPKGFPLSGVHGLGHENDWGALPIQDEEYDDSLSADFAIEYLKTRRSEPFFLACGLFRPHLPWYVPQQFFDLYPPQEIVLPAVKEDDRDDLPKAGKRFAKAREEDYRTIRNADKWSHAIRAYLASISYADFQLGRILSALDESPFAKNTIVVLWSDHGWHLGEKGHWHKSTLWEEATRVPLIVSAPELGTAKCSRPVNLIDLYPTLLELCDLPGMDSLDGVSLVPLLRQPGAKWHRPSVTEYRRGNAAVRDDRFRYIRYDDGGEELYDHVSDPNEWHNLAADPAHANTIKRLKNWLPQSWAKSAPTKKAYRFDVEKFEWTNLKTQTVVSGK